VWCPFAMQDVLRSGAGAFVNATAKIVHHTTEGSSYTGARSAYEKTGALPHFTDTFENGAYRVWQHLPIDQAATALKHPSGTPETNRANAVQIEHVGFAGRAHDFPDGYLLGIATLCRWIESERGVPRSAPFAFGPGAPRLSWEQWESFGGHFGHCHVPGNDHWDPGALDVGHILSAGIPPLPVPGPGSPRPGPGPAPLAVTPFPEDHMRRIDVDLGELDDHGWVRVPGVDASKVVSVVAQGAFPPADGYWNLPTFGRQARDGDTIIQVSEADPRFHDQLSVWVAD
jgi:hypothetical protein